MNSAPPFNLEGGIQSGSSTASISFALLPTVPAGMAGRGPAVMSRDVEPSLRVESHVKIYVRDDDPPLGRTTVPLPAVLPAVRRSRLHRGPVPLGRREFRLGNRPEKQNTG